MIMTILHFGGRFLADVHAGAESRKSNDDELGVRYLLVSNFCPSSAIASRQPALRVCAGCGAVKPAMSSHRRIVRLARLTPSRHAATPNSIIWKPTRLSAGSISWSTMPVHMKRVPGSVDSHRKERARPFFGLSPRLIGEVGDVCPWIIFRDGLLYFAAS